MKFSEKSETGIGKNAARCIDGERKHAEVEDSNETKSKLRKKDPQDDVGYWPDPDRADQEPIRDELRGLSDAHRPGNARSPEMGEFYMPQTASYSATPSTQSILDVISDRTSPIFWKADLLDRPSAWFGHIPFAHWLMSVMRPSVFVELGSHEGISYASFCRAALKRGIATRCYAVDTWMGDSHAGLYGDEVYNRVRQLNEEYESFSTLIRSTFDDALEKFEDGSIDLLHIDGFHSYEAVKHDFKTWKPKLSKRAVVLFHDTNEYQRDFGVWLFWIEMNKLYPSFEFLHEHGLGMLLYGEDAPDELQNICALNESDAIELRTRFQFAGQRWMVGAQLARSQAEFSSERTNLERSHNIEISELRAKFDEQNAHLRQQLIEVHSSTSWRLTRPIRAMKSTITRLKGRPRT